MSLEHGNDSGNTDGRPGSSTDVPSFHLPANDSSRTITICDASDDHGGYEGRQSNIRGNTNGGVGKVAHGGSKLEQFRNRILKRELSLLDVCSKSGADRARILQYEIDIAEHGAIRDWSVSRGGSQDQSEPRETNSAMLGVGVEVSRAMAAGHVLHVNGNIIWCTKCGGLTTGGNLRKLKVECGSSPMSNYTKYRLRRLERGPHPYQAAPMEGVTRKVRIADLSYRYEADRGGPFVEMYSWQGACTVQRGAGSASFGVEATELEVVV